jgi:hypothetical protein
MARLPPRTGRVMIAAMGARPDLEALRILGRYKRLVLMGKARVPLAEGRRLVGPDTAFHLYFRHAEPAAPRTRRRRARRRRPGRRG